MIISILNVRKGASCRIIFKAIPQMSIEQQQLEQQVFDLERSQEKNETKIIIGLRWEWKIAPYSSSIITSLVAPRGFRDRVAVKTIVNCRRLHDQIESVRNTKMGSSAIFLSLNESKNSIMSAAVPNNEKLVLHSLRNRQKKVLLVTNVNKQQLT